MVARATSKRYSYWDNGLHFSVDPNLRQAAGRDSFEADLAFYSSRDNAVLLVEETENPEPDKKDQLRAYLCVDKAVLATTFHSDRLEYLDVCIVGPSESRGALVNLVTSVREENPNRLGRNEGLAAHYYTTNFRFVRSAGRYSSPVLDASLTADIQTTRVHLIEILKRAPPISMLRYVILKATGDAEFMARGDGHVGVEELTRWLGARHLTDRDKWKSMLSLGGEIGILRNVDVNSLSAEIAYTVTHPRGLAAVTRFMSDPVGFARVPLEEEQKSLAEFLEEPEPAGDREEPGDGE
jgi:hypothetical protein